MNNIRLYAWKPVCYGEGYGPYSFFVAAKSEEDARKAVRQYISTRGIENYGGSSWPWNFELTVVDIGEVITNDNP